MLRFPYRLLIRNRKTGGGIQGMIGKGTGRRPATLFRPSAGPRRLSPRQISSRDSHKISRRYRAQSKRSRYERGRGLTTRLGPLRYTVGSSRDLYGKTMTGVVGNVVPPGLS